MHTRLLLTVLAMGLCGCSSNPKTPQSPAGPWVEAQIVQSAQSLAQAQTRLHQTSALKSANPLPVAGR
jgi:uncharacterized protein YcfL